MCQMEKGTRESAMVEQCLWVWGGGVGGDGGGNSKMDLFYRHAHITHSPLLTYA